ncbi:holin [Ureibacillus manganicus DSM 26584]|uniref:Holin n=2 Tax=Ureibacillus TaxID=160795 RepID=A0A0A3IU74_9BACL|nr:holin [Ureibacillus manganicus DSM 26584]
MGINWKVRFKHKSFWISIIALLSVFLNQVASIFNVDLTIYNAQITELAETVLMIFVFLGVIVDPTTEGIKDSEQALSYLEPRKK